MDYRTCEKRNKMRPEMTPSYGQSSVEETNGERLLRKRDGVGKDLRQVMKEALKSNEYSDGPAKGLHRPLRMNSRELYTPT